MSNLIFKPVVINRGRKFRGKAFFLGITTERAVAYNVSSWSTKLWEPVSKRFVYANPDFCEDDTSFDEFLCQQAREEYVRHVIDGTIAWCRAQKPEADDREVFRFARNVLKKHHPEMLEEINSALPECVNIREAISDTLTWASKLVTRPCFMYGRYCPGGKPYSLDRQLAVARRALEKKGLTNHPEFEEAWNQLTCR